MCLCETKYWPGGRVGILMDVSLDFTLFCYWGLLQSSALFHRRISFEAIGVCTSFGTSSSSHFSFQTDEFFMPGIPWISFRTISI